MARLPSYRYLIQQIDGQVVLFEDGSEREIVRFDPADRGATARAQAVIHFSAELSDEDKSFAHFWAGYFYAYNSMPGDGDAADLASRIDHAVHLATQGRPVEPGILIKKMVGALSRPLAFPEAGEDPL
jgi:hypothetical protein